MHIYNIFNGLYGFDMFLKCWIDMFALFWTEQVAPYSKDTSVTAEST